MELPVCWLSYRQTGYCPPHHPACFVLLLMCAAYLFVIAKYCFYSSMRQRMDCVALSAATLTAFFSCSLSHPLEAHEFAEYEASELWPGFGADFLGADPTRGRVGQLVEACEFVATNLVCAAFDRCFGPLDAQLCGCVVR